MAKIGDREIERRISRYLALAPKPGETSKIEPEKLNRAIGALDAVYWAKVEEIAASKATIPGPMSFNDEERLLIDAGLLDGRLVVGASPELRARLLSEFRQTDPSPCVYLTEWLVERHRHFVLMSEVDRTSAARPEKEEVAEQIERLRKARAEVYAALTPLMDNLPGLSTRACAAIATGRLDATMEHLIRKRRSEPSPELDRQLARLEAVHRQFMSKVIARCRTEKELKIIEGLRRMRLEIFRAVGRGEEEALGPAGAEEVDSSGLDPEKLRRFLVREARLIRSLLRIGTIGGRKVKAHSVLLRDLKRATRPEVGAVLRHVAEVDPSLSLDHTALIAPSTGSGFFEWDRDSLVVSLFPTRSAEDDVVNAVASYRMTEDELHFGGQLRKAYEQQFSGEKFTERFPRDYKTWVLKMGRGRREGMDEKTFQFFVERIGPNPAGPALPPALTRMTTAARSKHLASCKERIRSGAGTFGDHYHAGVLLWLSSDLQGAVHHLEQATAARPSDGRALYSLGTLLRRMRMRTSARRVLRDCVQKAPNTIWRVYASDALRRLR